jgi:hypothetical protein
MNKDLTVKEISEIPADVQELLGKPLVLPNENLEAYKKLFLQTANSVAPIDVIEWLWVEDIVHHTWEIRRLRLFKLELVRSAHDDVYEYTCKENKLVGEDERLAIKEWIEASDRGTTFAFLQEQVRYERIDALLRSAEARRNAALREIERHRQSFASRLRKASDDIIDGEFTEPRPVPAAFGQGKKGVLVKKGTQISPARVAELMKASINPGPKKGAA